MFKAKRDKINVAEKYVEPKKLHKLSDKGKACRILLGAFYINKKMIREGRAFYDGKDMDQVLIGDYGRMYKCDKWENIDISLRGAAGQLVKKEINLRFPRVDEGEDVSHFFNDSVLSKWAIKYRLIDDEYLSIFRAIMSAFSIIYDGTVVGFRPKEESAAILDKSVVEILENEIEQGYINKDIGDKSRGYAYTHILRRNLQLKLQIWQKDLVVNWKQFNYVAGSRRIGKTYTSAYLAKRELYRKGGGYGNRERQILFCCVSEEKMWQPLQYLLSMCKEDMALGYIKYTQKDKQFENTITGAKLIFRSAGSRTGAASYGADLVILDEAAMISDQFWEDLLPIIIQEGSTVFAISTINEDVKDNWFYRALTDAEMKIKDDCNAIRVTIDDNELLTEERKEAMKEALVHNPMKYWTQLYSIFPNGNTVFKLAGVIQPDNNINPMSVVIGYDPGKIRDNAALVVVDPNELRVIEEIIWKHATYKEQKEMMGEVKKKYPKSVIVMDRTGVGEAVAEMFGSLVDVGVKYKSSGETNFNAQYAYYQVSKMNLVDMLKMYFENHGLKINSSLSNLIIELRGFQTLTQGRRIIQYGGVGVKDDSVNALMLASFQMKHVFGLTTKGQAMVEDALTTHTLTPGYIDGLFEYDEYNDNAQRNFIY